jgi:hypothetical protein
MTWRIGNEYLGKDQVLSMGLTLDRIISERD